MINKNKNHFMWSSVIFILLLLSSCTSSSLTPEEQLCGQWKLTASENGNGEFSGDLEFLNDGKLLINNRNSIENDEYTFVVIAPGKMKISSSGQSEVVNYEISGNSLKIFIGQGYYLYTLAKKVDVVTPVPSLSQAISAVTLTKTDIPTDPAPAIEMTVVIDTPTPAHTSVPTITPTSTSTKKVTKIRIDTDVMEMVFVPAGEFMMGSSDNIINWTMDQNWCSICELGWFADEQPEHIVDLDSFWIDKFEVSNKQYQSCVSAGFCTKPSSSSSSQRKSYYGNDTYDDYPVVNINWHDASSYCTWVGGRLPTEAEWEKAARGGIDKIYWVEESRLFPWGKDAPTCRLTNFSDCEGDTVPVNSNISGVSYYGALNMGGNVWEWVSDWYDEDYYSSKSNWLNPTGPVENTDKKVVKGGAFGYIGWFVRVSTRAYGNPKVHLPYFGFRCALPGE
jgi:formylglycine-generating enzyme required for sulfatase activity